MSIFKPKSASSASPKGILSFLPKPRKATPLTSSGLDTSAISGAGVVPDGSGKRALARKGPRIALIAMIALVVLVVAGAIGVFALSFTDAFAVKNIEAQPTEHLDVDSIRRLSGVDEHTTLLNVDGHEIETRLKKNPWVASAKVSREFPETLRIEITERRVGAVVLLGNGNTAWNLGEDSVWIEPAKIDIPEGETATGAALAHARSIGALLIYDVPATTSPKACEHAGESTVSAVSTYMNEFSPEFSAQIVSFSANTEQSISCTLASGVTISLGEPTDVAAKERVITEILEQYPDQVTYINVRVPSRPSFRRVGTDSVQPGSGVSG